VLEKCAGVVIVKYNAVALLVARTANVELIVAKVFAVTQSQCNIYH